MKLLYFLDFMHFKQTDKSVTGQDYFAWMTGPVPDMLTVDSDIVSLPFDEAKERMEEISEVHKLFEAG